MDKKLGLLSETEDFLQSELLEQMRDLKLTVNIFLNSGIKLTGIVLNFDETIILLQNTGKQHSQGVQLIYKQAISTISVNENDVLLFPQLSSLKDKAEVGIPLTDKIN